MEFCPGCWVDTVWYLSGKSLNSPWKHRQGAGSLLGVSSCYVHTASLCGSFTAFSVGRGRRHSGPWATLVHSQWILCTLWTAGATVKISWIFWQTWVRMHTRMRTHVCTHTQPPCHRPLIPLTAPTPPYVLSRLISLWPFSHHHIPLQGCVPHTLIRPTLSVTNKVIFFCIHIQIYLALLSQRHPNWEGKRAPTTNLLLTTSKQWVHALYGGLLSGWGKRSLTECTPILNLHLLSLAFFLPIFVLQCFLQVEI